MADRLQNMIDAEIRKGHSYDGAYLEVYDAWKHLSAHFSDFYDEDSPVFRGLGTGKRSDAVQASVFDMIHAEILGEHNAEKSKVRNRRRADRKHPENKAERKKNELRRIRKLYGDVWEDGFEWWYENGKTGSKKFMEKDADIIRNMRESSAEEDARRDYMTETEERKVGYNTVQRFMYNADKRMREIRAEVVEKYGADAVDCYDDSYVVKCGDGGFQFPYPDEYYNEKAIWEDYEYMVRKYGMEYANKYAKGECY